jgi:IPT/TIG domain/Bacterial Ig-like domain (group 2)
LGDLGASPSEAPEGGITIVARGSNPKLIAQGKVLDAVTGFSTTLEFPDPTRQLRSALHASGLPVGIPPMGSPFAGMGNFVPHVVARNLLGTAQSVTITLEFPTGTLTSRGDKEFDGEGGEETGTVVLGPFSVGAYSTEDFQLSEALARLPQPSAYCSIGVMYSGPPGSLLAQISSVDSKQNLVVDSRAANEGDGWAGSGANPWHLDNETESILFLTNMSGKDARIGFQVTADDIHYFLTNLKLDPHETRAIDLRKLRNAQQPDFQGNKIPADSTDGSVNWIRLDNVPVMGRVVVISRHKGTASGYDCGTCQCPPAYTWLAVSPTSATVVAGSTTGYIATETWTTCNAGDYYYNVTGLAVWSSSDPAIASAGALGVVTGVKGGSVTITFCYTDDKYTWSSAQEECIAHSVTRCVYPTCNVKPKITSISPVRGPVGNPITLTIAGKGFASGATVKVGTISAGVLSISSTKIIANFTATSTGGNQAVVVTVGGQNSNSVNFYNQIPTSLAIVSGTDSTTSEATCSIPGAGTGCGIRRSFHYQVYDQESTRQPVQYPGLQFWDAFGTPSPNQLGMSSAFDTTCTPFGKTNSGPCGFVTDSNGQFSEDNLSVCSTVCYSGGVCVTGGSSNSQVNQTWYIDNHPIVQVITFYCNRVLVNGQ